MATRRILVGDRIFGASKTAQMMTLVISVMRINTDALASEAMMRINRGEMKPLIGTRKRLYSSR